MAFAKPKSAAVATPVVAGTFEKAAAFINLYLPSKTAPSGRTKIGAIPLREGKAFEAALIERLSSDPEAIKAMLSVLIVDFQAVSNEPVKADALGF